MEFDDTITRRPAGLSGPKNGGDSIDKNLKYPYRINLYVEPPSGQLSLDEAEDLFRQRLEMLHAFEIYKDANDELKNHLEQKIKSRVSKVNFFRQDNQDGRRSDHISHFLLRTYLAQTRASWDWFKTGERNLLYYRLKHYIKSTTPNELVSMLEHFGFNFERASLNEIHDLFGERIILANRPFRNIPTPDIVFKLNFEDALNLVQRRKVGLKNGFAYLLPDDIIGVVCDEFDSRMEDTYGIAGMIAMQDQKSRQLYQSLELVHQEHLEMLKESKKKQLESNREGSNPFSIQIDDIEDICAKHFPPCMRHIHENLKKENHLRHQARVYYGAFLRSGGVDLDSALKFWRDEFTKKIPVDRFERDYKYNIRHLYGKEGHKKALSCFTCAKIISDNPPGPIDNHACPFRHFDQTHLRKMLQSHGLISADVDTICRLSEEKLHQNACTHYFQARHGDLPVEPIRTPIQFYYESVRHMKYGPPPKRVQEDGENLDQNDMNGEIEPPEVTKEKVPEVDNNKIEEFFDDNSMEFDQSK